MREQVYFKRFFEQILLINKYSNNIPFATNKNGAFQQFWDNHFSFIKQDLTMSKKLLVLRNKLTVNLVLSIIFKVFLSVVWRFRLNINVIPKYARILKTWIQTNVTMLSEKKWNRIQWKEVYWLVFRRDEFINGFKINE